METVNDDFKGILFVNAIDDYDFMVYSGQVLHILCTAGSMSFIFQDVRYNILPGDYVIFPNVSLASGFSESQDFKAIVMVLSEAFVTSLALKSNYGIIGHLSLLQNPVMKLSDYDFRKCREDMERLRERCGDKGHHFRDEMLGHLLMAHILDLYDIHARGQARQQVPERAQQLLRRFIGMLYDGEYIKNRDLRYYASQLCITPHYLSEICRNASSHPALYWIDRFTMHEIARLLRQKDLPLTEIADRMNFSSLSYFSRYVKKHIGLSPAKYRNNYAAD